VSDPNDYIPLHPTYVNGVPHCPTCDEALRSHQPALGISYCSCGVWFENKEQGEFDFHPFPEPGKNPTMRPIYIDNTPHCPTCNQEFYITVHGNWVCHCNVWVKTNEHDDELEIHPYYRPDVLRYNVGGRSYVRSTKPFSA
jgi:hypothetical protein